MKNALHFQSYPNQCTGNFQSWEGWRNSGRFCHPSFINIKKWRAESGRFLYVWMLNQCTTKNCNKIMTEKLEPDEKTIASLNASLEKCWNDAENPLPYIPLVVPPIWIRKNQTCRLTKTMRFKKYKNDAYKKNGERGPIQHDQSPPFFFHLNPL